MRIAVLPLPDSRLEPDLLEAIRCAGMEPVVWSWADTAVLPCDGYLVTGTYFDAVSARVGRLLAWGPLLDFITAESEQGKPVLGLGRGAQLLVDAGLVPGADRHQVSIALTDNQQTGAQSACMRLTDDFQYNAFTQYLTPKTILPVTLTETQGRFVIPPGLLAEMRVQGLGLFQYCDAAGVIRDEFPLNPTGSVNNIAGVSNKAGNVLALVPQPAMEAIFRSLAETLARGYVATVTPLHYQPRVMTTPVWRLAMSAVECLQTIATPDPEAEAVERVLRETALSVAVTRAVHWEIIGDTPAALAQLRRTEIACAANTQATSNAVRYLIRPKAAEAVLPEALRDLPGIRVVRQGMLWQFAGADAAVLNERVLHTALLYNPLAEDCFHYGPPLS